MLALRGELEDHGGVVALNTPIERLVRAPGGWEAYFGGSDIPSWTMEHPEANPLEDIRAGLPPSDDRLRHKPISWIQSGIQKQLISLASESR